MRSIEQFVDRAMRSLAGSALATCGKEGCVFLVALSGGPDSVALLRILKTLGYNIHAAHCNFHLRGTESDRDEGFCKDLCGELHVPLHIAHFDTFSYAGLHKVSIEMAARELRYHWFAQLSHDIGAEGVCVAHHQDDQVETVLLNIIRGTGLKGLLGMRAKTLMTSHGMDTSSPSSFSRGERGGAETVILRPMLSVAEAQIMDYLKETGQDYVIDSTNLQDEARRNKLRLDIIPLLEKVNPAFKANLIRMTENLSGVEAIVKDSLANAAEATAIILPSVPSSASSPALSLPEPLAAFSIPRLRAYSSPLTLLWSILSPYGFNRSQVEEVAASAAGNCEWKNHESIAIVSHDILYVVNRRQWETPLPSLRIPEAGLYRYGGDGTDGNSSGLHIRVSLTPARPDSVIPKERYHIALDGSTVSFPLLVRPVRAGDRLTPFGMRGSKLVSDYLKDRHRSVMERHRQLVMTDGSGQIVWLVGETVSDNNKVVLRKTTEILEIIFE